MPYLPALIFGIVMTAYWGRVMRLVYKIRRQTGKDANFTPKEQTGKALRIIWRPVVVLWIAIPFLSAFATKLPPGLAMLPTHPALAWAAVAVGLVAFGLTLVCWKRMGKSWRMGINPNEKTQLIVSGPYAFVRHPIYALSSLLMIATAAAVPSPAMLAVAALHLVLLQLEARREEKYLIQVQGDLYVQYQRSVGRFIPRSLRPYRP